MAMENPPFLIGDTSSIGGFSIVMLVFHGLYDLYTMDGLIKNPWFQNYFPDHSFPYHTCTDIWLNCMVKW